MNGLDLAGGSLKSPDLKPSDGCRPYRPARRRQPSLMLLRLNEGEIPAANFQKLGGEKVAVVAADEFLWGEG